MTKLLSTFGILIIIKFQLAKGTLKVKKRDFSHILVCIIVCIGILNKTIEGNLCGLSDEVTISSLDNVTLILPFFDLSVQ